MTNSPHTAQHISDHSLESIKVYTAYNVLEPPIHPGSDWTRFICISDTHSKIYKNIPPGDVLLHGGDLSRHGTLADLMLTINWLKTLDHAHKIIIAGNHDLCLDSNLQWDDAEKAHLGDPKSLAEIRAFMKSRDMIDARLFYLEYESLALNLPSGRSWKIYGIPGSELYNIKGCFQYSTSEEANELFNRIPSDTEILLTHSPPYGILDKAKKNENAGSPELTERLSSLPSLKLHVFGHIHEAFGVFVSPSSQERVFVNASIAKENLPVIVDLKN